MIPALRYAIFTVFLLRCSVTKATELELDSDTAKSARYIINHVDWIAIATISTLGPIKGYPFANVKSVSDGPLEKGTGVPYLLMNDMDLSGKDVLVDSRVTLLATLAEVEYCEKRKYDAQDPRCGRLFLIGRLVPIKKGDPDYAIAKDFLFKRHPTMELWMKVHKFYFAKVNIEQVLVLDYFGGAKNVTVKDYFNGHSAEGAVPMVKLL